MKYHIFKNHIEVEPEDEMDIAYIENILGLKNNEDSIRLIRKNYYGSNEIDCLVTEIVNSYQYNPRACDGHVRVS